MTNTETFKTLMDGHWIISYNPGTHWYRITCSECGEDVTSSAPCIGFLPNAKFLWNYCPYCGAKNEVEERHMRSLRHIIANIRNSNTNRSASC